MKWSCCVVTSGGHGTYHRAAVVGEDETCLFQFWMLASDNCGSKLDFHLISFVLYLWQSLSLLSSLPISFLVCF